MNPRLCFLIPASPTDGFFGQIAMFRRSLDALGDRYRAARIVAVLGSETIPAVSPRWMPHFDRVSIERVDSADFRKHSYFAQVDARWELVPEECDFAIFSDADTMVLRPFDDLLSALTTSHAVAGSIAHYPFPQHPGDAPNLMWAKLGRDLLGRELPLRYRHTLVPPATPEDIASCPFYVNFGFVIVPREHVGPIGRSLTRLRPLVAERLREPYFAGQAALALAVDEVAAPRVAIDIRYNFPNDESAESRYPESLKDMRVVHYLRTHHFNRQRIFADRGQFEQFLALTLTGSELIFQQHVARIAGDQYPY